MIVIAGGLLVFGGLVHMVLAVGSRVAQWCGLYDDDV